MASPVVVIPAYKPAPCLPEMVRQLAASAEAAAILLVDDGSGPDFQPLFRDAAQAGAILLLHPANCGKGAALKTAFREAAARFPDHTGIVTADADGQHTVADIRRIARALAEHPHSLVLGARRFDASVPWRSRIGNQLTRHVVRRIAGAALTDTQTGLRGIPMDFAPVLLRSPYNRYEFELDMLLRWHSTGRPIFEVAIETLYPDRNRLSHFHPLIDSLRVYRVILGRTWRR